ncbi:MAG: hypothetical protein ACRC5R_05590 [Mycoplasmatales bacterium]
MKSRIFVVNHTHWDREWYKTKDQFLIHLKSGVEYLIKQFEDGKINYFYFDAQTIIVEDLKTVLSKKNYFDFITLIKNKKIEIGPWFVLPDEGLIDDIGFLKNLEIGTKICENLKVKPSNVLYMPDTFGHNNRMPTIAKQYGLKNAIIHRGLTTSQVDCIWKDEENSLKTIVLPTREGYYQTMFHHSNYVELFEKYVNDFQNGNIENDVLILNGCDHTFIPLDFKEKFDNLKNKYSEKYEFIETNLSNFFEKTKYTFDKEISGEFRSASKAFLLPGVLSTRYYLKNDNRNVTDLLRYFYEPISNVLGNYENECLNIDNLWKKVIENHPHDSICGCSIDSVHREMEIRTKQILDNANTAIFEQFNSKFKFEIEQLSTSKKFTNDKIVVFNHLQKDFHIVKMDIQINLDALLDDKVIKKLLNGYELSNVVVPKFDLLLKNNKESYFVEIIKIEKKEVLLHNFHTEPCYTYVVKASIVSELFLNEGMNNFQICIVPKKEIPEIKKISISKNGSLTIDGKKINLVNYHYISDRGDSYNFDPIGEYKKIKILESIVKKGVFYDKYTFTSKELVGDALEKCRTKRNDNLKEIIIKTNIFAYKDKIQIESQIVNKHKDIKIVSIYDDINSLYSNVALDILERNQIENISYDAITANNEVQYNQSPSLSEILLNEKMQISHLGNSEVEILDNKVLHSLFRATGDLSRRDLFSRKGGAGPSYEAEECQCLRKMEFKFLLTNSSKIKPNKHLELYDFKSHQYSNNIE